MTAAGSHSGRFRREVGPSALRQLTKDSSKGRTGRCYPSGERREALIICQAILPSSWERTGLSSLPGGQKWNYSSQELPRHLRWKPEVKCFERSVLF